MTAHSRADSKVLNRMSDQINYTDALSANLINSDSETITKPGSKRFSQAKDYFVVACVLTVNNLVYNTLFIILGAMATQRGYDEKQIGFLGSAFLFGQLIANLSGALWVNKVDWRLAVGGSGIACALFMAGAAFVNYTTLIGFYLLAGSMTGVALSCAFCHMSGMQNPVRAYSISLIMQCLVAGAVILLLQSYILPKFGFIGLSYTIAATFILAIFTAPWLPKGIDEETNKHQSASVEATPKTPSQATAKGAHLISKDSILPMLGLVAIAVYFLGQTSIWAFIERIGHTKGFDANSIGTMSAAVLILCSLGAWAASITGQRLGNIKPLFIGTIGFLVAIIVLYYSDSRLGYFLSFLLYASAWNYVLPYQLLMVSQGHKNSVYASIIPAFQSVGASAGPAVVGLLVVGGNSYVPAYLLAISTAIFSLVIFLVVHFKSKK